MKSLRLASKERLTGRTTWEMRIVYVVDASLGETNDYSDARENLKSLLDCQPLLKGNLLLLNNFKYDNEKT